MARLFDRSERQRRAGVFADRRAAGVELARALERFADERPIVLALPRGGVPVAYEVALALNAPLDVCVVRKVGVPWQPELGMGAVAEGGYVELSAEVLVAAAIPRQEALEHVELKQREVEERVRRFRRGQPPLNVRGRSVILVDDGVATGGSVRVAIRAVRARQPRRLVLAVPVAAARALEELQQEADEVVSLAAPTHMSAVGLWYRDFQQVSDEEVVRLLEAARRHTTAATGAPAHSAQEAADARARNP